MIQHTFSLFNSSSDSLGRYARFVYVRGVPSGGGVEKRADSSRSLAADDGDVKKPDDAKKKLDDKTNKTGSEKSDVPSTTKNELQRLRREVTGLANKLDTTVHAATLLDLIEKEDIDTSRWHDEPRKILPLLEKYAANTELKDEIADLSKYLGMDAATEQYKIAAEAVFAIAENIGRRRAEIKRVHDQLQGIRESSENPLNQKVTNFAKNTMDTFGRMSMPEKIASAAAMFFLANMVFKKADDNGWRTAAMVGVAGLAGNLLVQDFTGKSAVDWAGEKLGLERFMPMSKDGLPAAIQGLARATGTTMPSELHAIAKMGGVKMGDILANYHENEHSITPYRFGLTEKKSDGAGEPGEISGKQLFKIVDSVMKKPNIRIAEKDGTIKTFHNGKDFVKTHPDYDFATVVYWLYEKEAIASISAAFSNDEDRTKYVGEVKRDMEMMLKTGKLVASDYRVNEYSGNVSFFGITFLTERKQDNEDKNSQYIFHLEDEDRVAMHLQDNVGSKEASLDLLQLAARKYLEKKIAPLVERNPAFKNAKLEWGGQTAVGGKTKYMDNKWHVVGVKLNSGGKTDTADFELVERNDGRDTCNLFLRRSDGKKETSLVDFENHKDVLDPSPA